MNEVFMVRVDLCSSNGKLLDVSFHGAFKSFRSASLWLVGEGYEVVYDNDSSQLLEADLVYFVVVDKENNEEYSAFIETYSIFD